MKVVWVCPECGNTYETVARADGAATQVTCHLRKRHKRWRTRRMVKQ